jgi:hypothetical protein
MWFYLICLLLVAEQSPPPESPYPEAPLTSQSLGVEQPVNTGRRGEYYYDTKKKRPVQKPFSGVEQPTRVGDDGAYYYTDELQDEPVNTIDGVEQPIDTDSDGGYYYKKEKKKQGSQVKYGPQPTQINADGSYVYDTNIGETKNTFFFRGGVQGSPAITASSGASFDDVYGTDDKLLFSFEYDWKLTSNLFLKLGSGITTTEGQGRFADGSLARERFTFFVFPNTLSVSYKFQIADIQYLTPYVEGGPGYFTFIESRNDGDLFSFDGETTKFGGAFVATAGVGLLISLSKFTSGTSLQTDYGATQSWIDLHYRQVFGLDRRKDFSSNMITGGFAIGF